MAGWALFGVGRTQDKSDKVNPASPEAVRVISSVDGAALFKAYCTACHGADGKGDGPMATFLKAAPSDLTRIAVRNHGVYPGTRVERIISGEEQIARGHGTRDMPVWGPIFSQIAWDQDFGRIRVRNLAGCIAKLQAR
jgi:mono/diheme cytochrome c family protein